MNNQQPVASKVEPQITKEFNYEDETGKLLYQVVRYEPKGFSQRRPDGNGGWICNVSGVEKVLYRLPQLVRAELDEWIFITEGEKDADRITKTPMFARCWLRLSRWLKGSTSLWFVFCTLIKARARRPATG